MKLDPHNCYKTYLALKNHFTKDTYDFHKYNGKTRSSLQSFYKRKDRFFFEKMSRQKTDDEILEFFVANFASCSDPQSLWIGEIIKEGEKSYKDWKKRNQKSREHSGHCTNSEPQYEDWDYSHFRNAIEADHHWIKSPINRFRPANQQSEQQSKNNGNPKS